MNAARLEEMEELFSLALDLSPEQRSAFLEQRLGDDPWMKRRVSALLRADRSAREFLHVPADDLPRIPEVDDVDVAGRQLGRYTIQRAVATGGMGVVYEATQQQPSRRVALKVMRAGLSGERLTRRFRHEVEILGRLQHPHIARIYDAGVFDDADWLGGPVPYFAMEWVDGQPITEYVAAAQLSLEARLQLLAQVCRAVQYAHQKSVIHRDLKPANILVDQLGQPKILDFGVALATRSDAQFSTERTEASEIIGTVAYMSPEQMLADSERIDTRSDVYALGILYYRLLAGRLPHDLHDKTVPEAVHIVWTEEPRGLAAVDRRFRGDLDTIARKALQKDRTQRYQSASDLAQDIEGHLAGAPIAAHPPSTLYQLGKLVQRHRWPVALGAVTVGLVFVFSIVAAVLLVQLERQRQAALQARDQENRARLAETQQRELAERRFEDVRELATTFVFDVHDSVQQLEGATAARDLIVSTGLRYLDSLYDELDTTDPRLTLDLADGYLRIAFLQGDPYTMSLGDTAAAQASCERALHLADTLEGRLPRDRLELVRAGARQLLGSIAGVTGEGTRAVELYASALEHRQHAAELGADPLLHPRLDRIHHRLALSQTSMTRLTPALSHARQAVELLQPLQREFPDDPHLYAELAQTRLYLGNVHLLRREYAESFAPTEAALAVLEKLVSDQPHNSIYRRDRATARMTLGRALAGEGERDRAVELLESALQDYRLLVQRDPHDASARENVAICLHVLGNQRVDRAELDLARECFEQMQIAASALARDYPDSPTFARQHAMSEHALGSVLRRSGQVRAALEHYNASRAIFERLVEVVDHPTAQRDLAVMHFETAVFHQQLAGAAADAGEDDVDDWRAARRAFIDTIEIYEHLRELQADLPVDREIIARLRNDVATCDAALLERGLDPTDDE